MRLYFSTPAADVDGLAYTGSGEMRSP